MSDFSRRIAIIIGINKYQEGTGIPILQNAVKDAEKIADILSKKPHEYEIKVFLDRDATKENLEKLLESLSKEVKPDECLLFYFAGHGVALERKDGPQGYLIPQDAQKDNISSYLRMIDLHDWLSALECRHFLGILDCCFSGAFRWSINRDFSTVPEEIYQEHYTRFIQEPAWQIITSASYDETAPDAFSLSSKGRQTSEHSPFAAALIEALEEGKADIYPPANNGKSAGDGVITAHDLYSYILQHFIKLETDGHSQRQTPGLWPLKKHDKGEYIFLNPNHPLNLPPAPPLDKSKNPYRGLESFREEDSKLFFGRTALIDKLYNFVQTNRLTVVLGASGTGKSSLVRAGLIPELRNNQPSWTILNPVRPGESPFQELNQALKQANLLGVEPPDTASAQSLKNLKQSVTDWKNNNPDSKLLLFIDQSEELITLCKNEVERQAFLSQLAHAITTHPDELRVVITIRSDFEPQLRDLLLELLQNTLQLEETAINNTWQTARFIVPQMTRAELRAAIKEPAEARVMYFEPDSLVEQLVDEVADMPGALPLLSFALSELYLKYLQRQTEARNQGITINRTITEADYEAIGGVTQSLTKRADAEYEALTKVDSSYEQIIRNVMLRMVAVGGGELARRRVPMWELNYPETFQPQVEEIIKRFCDARLLVKGTDAEELTYVEPAHDALVRGWKNLKNWVDAQKNLELQHRLTQAAYDWSENRKSRKREQQGLLWNDDPRLALFEQMLPVNAQRHDKSLDKFDGMFRRLVRQVGKTVYQFIQPQKKIAQKVDQLNQSELEFVLKSVNFRYERLGQIVGVTILTGSVLIAITIGALIGQRNAVLGQIRSSRQASEAFLNTGDQQLEALTEAVKAAKILQSNWILKFIKPDRQLQTLVRGALWKSFYQTQEQNRLQRTGWVYSASFSPDGNSIVTGSNDKTAKLWNLEGKALASLNHSGPIISASFSPDGNSIVTASIDGTAKLWNLEGKALASLNHSGSVRSASFSPDGNSIVTASDDGTAKLWNLEGKELVTIKHSGSVRSASFSPDGNSIVTASDDGTAKLWNLEGKELATIEHSGSVNSASFSPDGNSIVTASDDGTAKLWNLEGKELATIEHSGSVNSASFSPDGNSIVTASDDGTAKLWNLEGKELASLNHSGTFNSTSFSPDGNSIVTASSDGTAKLWNLEGKELASLKHKEWVNSASFSLEGKELASLKHNEWVNSASFSPDGNSIVTASFDGTAKLWPFPDLNELTAKACARVGNYLKNYPDVEESDRDLCDGISSTDPKSQNIYQTPNTNKLSKPTVSD